jgi:hypothetical protein
MFEVEIISNQISWLKKGEFREFSDYRPISFAKRGICKLLKHFNYVFENKYCKHCKQNYKVKKKKYTDHTQSPSTLRS